MRQWAPGEGVASEIEREGKVGLVAEVLMTPGDWRPDVGNRVEAEAIGQGDGMNVGLWSEREVGKIIWFGGRWCTHVETCCL